MKLSAHGSRWVHVIQLGPVTIIRVNNIGWVTIRAK